MGKVTRKEWYRRVNATWPEIVPKLTADEAVRAAKRLYRFGMKRTFRDEVIITSGNRDTWIRYDQRLRTYAMFVNPEKGWRDLVHMLSHWCHDRTAPSDEQGHNAHHARAEIRMIKEVIRRGWLDGKLKVEPKPEPVAPTKQDVQLERWRRTAAAITRWEAKLKRAENALRKLRRRERYYQRALSDKQAA